MRIIAAVVSLVALLLVGGDDSGPRLVMSPVARDYLNHAIGLLQHNALDRHRIDWPLIRDRALRVADGARTPTDTYPAIHHVINALNNPHTFFQRPEEATRTATQPERIPVPTTQLVDGRFAHLIVPAMQGDEAVERHYVEAGAAAIRSVDATSLSGWIIDLRANHGGNMWPMITVLAPILGEGRLGSFVDPDGSATDWELRDGTALLGGQRVVSVSNRDRLRHPHVPIAVLTARATASAGEATLIAFRGLPRARVFGGPTAGFATANETFSLSDGAVIVLTVAIDADRTGRHYGNEPVRPDEPVAPNRAVAAAATWLASQQ